MRERQGASRRFRTPPAASALPLTTHDLSLDKVAGLRAASAAAASDAPAGQLAEPVARRSNRDSLPAASGGGKIPIKRAAIEAVLQDSGYHLVMADSGREALRLLLQDEFAVILLDVRMPGMDGFELAGLIRQRSTTMTPIIFVTSFDSAEADLQRG